MGGSQSEIAINEAIFMLDKLAPERLEDFRRRFPNLAEQLQEGVFAGPEEARTSGNSFLIEKAEVLTAALSEASGHAENAMITAGKNIKRARRRRLVSQVLVLIGSSSLLGAVALDEKTATVISAVLTLLAALGNLLAEHYEKLLNPQAGNIYEMYQKLGEGAYKARRMASELQLAMRHDEAISELSELLRGANELCEQLNAGLLQLLTELPASKSRP